MDVLTWLEMYGNGHIVQNDLILIGLMIGAKEKIIQTIILCEVVHIRTVLVPHAAPLAIQISVMLIFISDFELL